METELATAAGGTGGADEAAAPGEPGRPSAVAVWWRALRAYSFPASIVPCVVGAAFAATAGAPVRWAFLPLVLLAGVALHVGTNLVNDVADFTRGVDSGGAQGGSGVLQAGWLTPHRVWAGAFLAFGLAVLAGLPLLAARGWPLAVVGLVGGVGGYAYTGPPFGLKYRALGEVAVFLLMGTLMVAGSALALAGAFPPGVWAASIPVGFLVAAILAANNQRDREDDARHPMRTLAILLGPRGARAVTLALLAGAYVSVPVLWAARVLPSPALLALLTVPLAAPPAREVLRTGPEHRMAPGTVERIAALHLFFGLTYAAGLGLAAAL
jgi:1,4-dihydroxy-2-naphthoate octaprenyltransferase